MKQPLALLPGLLCDARLWRHQSAHLADVADPWIADFTTQDSIAGMARSVLEAMPRRFALAGLSMGGYVALEVMRQAPERVIRLCLLDTSVRPDTPEQTRRRRDLLALVARGKFKGVTRQMLPLFLHPARLKDTALTDTVMAMAAHIGREAYVRQQTSIMNRADSRPGLGAIGCPATVICGRQDTLTPLAVSEEIAAGIPGARLEIVKDCGHLTTMERPAEVTALMRDWLLAAA
ncbi:MAG: alpha/beta fold hydrolase [Rhodospirillales bacterium]